MVTLKNNELLVNGKKIKSYRPFSNPFTIVKWLIERKKFYKREAEIFCSEEEIGIASFEVEISSLNRVVKEKLGEPLFLRHNKYNPLYCLNPVFDDDNELMVVYVPRKKAKELRRYQIKEYDEN